MKDNDIEPYNLVKMLPSAKLDITTSNRRNLHGVLTGSENLSEPSPPELFHLQNDSHPNASYFHTQLIPNCRLKTMPELRLILHKKTLYLAD